MNKKFAKTLELIKENYFSCGAILTFLLCLFQDGPIERINIINLFFYIIASLFLIHSCVSFYQVKKNPSDNPISKAMTLGILALISVALPFLMSVTKL